MFNSSALSIIPAVINCWTSCPTILYEIVDGTFSFGGGFVGAGGVFAGSSSTSLLGVLERVFALGGGLGITSITISSLAADFGLEADLALGAVSTIILVLVLTLV